MSRRKKSDVVGDAIREFEQRQAEMNKLLHGVALPDRELHRLGLIRPPTKAAIKDAILAEAARRERIGEPFTAPDLHRWQFGRFGRSKEAQQQFYSEKQIRRWINNGEHRKPLKLRRRRKRT